MRIEKEKIIELYRNRYKQKEAKNVEGEIEKMDFEYDVNVNLKRKRIDEEGDSQVNKSQENKTFAQDKKIKMEEEMLSVDKVAKKEIKLEDNNSTKNTCLATDSSSDEKLPNSNQTPLEYVLELESLEVSSSI
jgi:hypothetical protein